MGKLKIIGAIATIGSLVLTIVADAISTKETEEMIDKKINDAMKK